MGIREIAPDQFFDSMQTVQERLAPQVQPAGRFADISSRFYVGFHGLKERHSPRLLIGKQRFNIRFPKLLALWITADFQECAIHAGFAHMSNKALSPNTHPDVTGRTCLLITQLEILKARSCSTYSPGNAHLGMGCGELLGNLTD